MTMAMSSRPSERRIGWPRSQRARPRMVAVFPAVIARARSVSSRLAPLSPPELARIACPVLFLVQTDDELVPPERALALFCSIGSTDKRLHAHPGAPAAVPTSAWARRRRGGLDGLPAARLHLAGPRVAAAPPARGGAQGGALLSARL